MNSLTIDITIERWLGFEVTLTGRLIAVHRADAVAARAEAAAAVHLHLRAIVQLEQERGKRGLGEQHTVALARGGAMT